MSETKGKLDKAGEKKSEGGKKKSHDPKRARKSKGIKRASRKKSPTFTTLRHRMLSMMTPTLRALSLAVCPMRTPTVVTFYKEDGANKVKVVRGVPKDYAVVSRNLKDKVQWWANLGDVMKQKRTNKNAEMFGEVR